jgi:hypothetical protein
VYNALFSSSSAHSFVYFYLRLARLHFSASQLVHRWAWDHVRLSAQPRAINGIFKTDHSRASICPTRSGGRGVTSGKWGWLGCASAKASSVTKLSRKKMLPPQRPTRARYAERIRRIRVPWRPTRAEGVQEGSSGGYGRAEPSISSCWSVVCRGIPRTCLSNCSRSFSLFFGVRTTAILEWASRQPSIRGLRGGTERLKCRVMLKRPVGNLACA